MDFDKYQNGYAVLPLKIALKLNEKSLKLYVIILTLTNWKGYCWASNTYFSELLNYSIPTIKRLLKNLKDEQLISISGNTTHRKIYVSQVQNLSKLGSPVSRAEIAQLTSEPRLGSPVSQAEKDTLYINNNNINNNKTPCQIEGQSDVTLLTPYEEIFGYWQVVMNHPRSKLDPKRKRVIKNAIQWGYSTDDLKQAILGCSLTPHNMGNNDRGQRYDGLELIFRHADQIDRFMSNALKPPVELSKASKRLGNNLAALQSFLSKEGASNG